MTTFLQISTVPFSQLLRGSITDRKDFYHQFSTTPERTSLNVIYPPFSLKNFEGTAAHQKFCEEFSGGKRKRRRREVVGDHLHGAPDPIVFEEDMTVLAGFGALFQGDHLGVEVATDSHSNLLIDAGLLLPGGRLRSDIPVAEDKVTDGLVIDD